MKKIHYIDNGFKIYILCLEVPYTYYNISV